MSKKRVAKKELVSKKYAKRSQVGEVFYRLRKNKGALVGMLIFGLIVLGFLASVFFISYKMITEGSVSDRLRPPDLAFPFGADHMGRNLFLRVLYGSRYSLSIGFGGSLIAATFGITLGSIAGYYGGFSESLIMRFAEVLSSIPGMLLGMVIMSTLGSSLPNLIFTVGVTSIPIYIRMTRASILSIRDLEYVDAARSMGYPNPRIILSQIIPNGMSPLIVTFTMNLGMMVMVAS